MKDPAFLFYPGDYLRDTQCLSETAQVAYDRIMCEHMRNICISQSQLDFFTKRLTPDQKTELMLVLTPCPGGFCIPWVVDSIQKRREYSESRRKNRVSKKKEVQSKQSKDMNNICESYVNHMENEIENENEDVIKSKKESKEEIESAVLGDQAWMDTLRMTHPGKDIGQAWRECWAHHSGSPSPPEHAWQWKQKLNTWLTIKQNNKHDRNNSKASIGGASAIIKQPESWGTFDDALGQHRTK